MRNRRHLRKIPGKQVVQEEEEGEEKDDEDLWTPTPSSSPGPSSGPSSSPGPSPGPSQTDPSSPAKPAVPADSKPVITQHNPVQPEQSDSSENTDGIRRSGRSSNPPSRLEVTGNGKSYAAAVKTRSTDKQVSVGGGRCGLAVPSLPRQGTRGGPVYRGRSGGTAKP